MEFGLLISAQGDWTSRLSKTLHELAVLDPDYLWSGDSMMRSGIPKLAGRPGFPAQFSIGKMLDPFVVLASVASGWDVAPRRCPPLGIAVSDFIRRTPADLARSAFTLTQMTDMPFNLGVGVGVPNNVMAAGCTYPGKPVDFFERGLDALCRLNTPDTRDNTLTLNSLESSLDYGERPSRIWVGGHRDRMLDLAARHADGWIPAIKMTADDYGRRVKALQSAAARYGRPCPVLGLYVSVMLGPSRESLLARVEEHPSHKIPALFGTRAAWESAGETYPSQLIAGGGDGGTGSMMLSQLDPELLYDLLLSMPARLIETAYFIGNAKEVAEQLHAFRNQGLQQIVLPAPNITEAGLGLDESAVFNEYLRLTEEIRRW